VGRRTQKSSEKRAKMKRQLMILREETGTQDEILEKKKIKSSCHEDAQKSPLKAAHQPLKEERGFNHSHLAYLPSRGAQVEKWTPPLQRTGADDQAPSGQAQIR
jgi:hypothetical protein